MPRNGNNKRGLGDNVQAYAPEVTARLGEDYAEMVRAADLQIDQADSLPDKIENEDDLQAVSEHIVRLRDTGKRAKAAHDAEKAPYLRAGQAVDGFFNSIVERVGKIASILNERVGAFQIAKAARERARRQREQEEARRREEAAQAEAAERRRQAELAERKAETARRNTELAREKAIDANADADAAEAEALVARDQADAAAVQAAKPAADMARSRFDTGRLATLRRVPYAEIVDPDALDSATLWPFVTDDAKAAALRAWARTTNHKQSMPGARVGFREQPDVR